MILSVKLLRLKIHQNESIILKCRKSKISDDHQKYEAFLRCSKTLFRTLVRGVFDRHVNGLVRQGVNIRKACADGAHDKRKLFNALEKHKIEHAIKHQAKKQCVDASKRLCKQSQRSKKIQRTGS